jgi:glycosyltransferase involved in cell wall biosynthesis
LFILITPVHNELNEIDGLVQCVRESSFSPDIWIIVDDASDDGSTEKLQSIAMENSFIRLARIDEKATYMEFHISDVFRRGVEEIPVPLSEINYIGFLDADVRFGRRYWEQLRLQLDRNDLLGVVSGILCSYNKSNALVIEPFQRIDNARGGLRLVKGECFRQIGGVKRSRTWDAIMNVQARLGGWQTAIKPDIYALSTRPTDDRFGRKKGEQSRGKREWHLHQPIVQVLVRAVFKVLHGNFTGAVYYLKGYLGEKRVGGEQFPDTNVRHYYRVIRMQEWLTSLICKLTGRNDPHSLIPVKKVTEHEIFV